MTSRAPGAPTRHARPARGPARRALASVARHPALAAGAATTLSLLLLGLFGPLLCDLAGADPLRQDLYHPFGGLSLRHPLGTDAFGRDILTRLLFGARYSLIEVAASLTLSCGGGTLLGLAAAAIGGRFERLAMWFMDVLFAFPGIILALLTVSLLGPGLGNMLLAISLFSLPVYARLSRNLARGLRHAGFVEAAVSIGAGPARIMLHHVLPNIAGPILVQCTVSAGSIVLSAAALSFLGLGVQPPMPEWGAMMSDGRNYVGAHLLPSLFPGLAITGAALGFNMLGEGARARLGDDPD